MTYIFAEVKIYNSTHNAWNPLFDAITT